jgi:hypothetical protein
MSGTLSCGAQLSSVEQTCRCWRFISFGFREVQYWCVRYLIWINNKRRKALLTSISYIEISLQGTSRRSS